MSSGLNPVDSQGVPSHLTPRGAVRRERGEAVDRIESVLDYRAIAAAQQCASALGLHVVCAYRHSALRGPTQFATAVSVIQKLADVSAAQGIASSDYANRKHSHTWLITWQRLALDDEYMLSPGGKN